MKAHIAMLLALALGASGAVYAGTGDRDKAAFDKLDSDGNGSISKQEAEGKLKSNFDEVDRDGNGEISATEYALGARQQSGQ